MSPRYGFVRDLPLPMMHLAEGDVDAIDFTLTQADGTAIDLTSVGVIELRMRPLRGAQTVLSFKTTDASPKLTVVTPTAGKVRFTPAAGTFAAAADQYRMHFMLGSGQRVPQDDDFFLDVGDPD